MFGGFGVAASGRPELLHDLWSFDASKAGPSSTSSPWTRINFGPTPRATHSLFMAAGKLWLHGGEGSAGFLGDLWSFGQDDGWHQEHPVAAGAAGVYGGEAPPQRGAELRPGARKRQTFWHDRRSNDTVWMLGGEGADANGQDGWLDDLWRLRLGGATAEWEWVGGSKVAAGYAPPLQWGPSGRASVAVLNGGADEEGKALLFGGYRMLGRSSEVLNDLWELTITL